MAKGVLERATTRRIAEEAGVPHGAFHYPFRDRNELLTSVVRAVTLRVEQVLRDAVDPARGLAAAIEDGLHAFRPHVLSDDGRGRRRERRCPERHTPHGSVTRRNRGR
jgi:AcrR family transcriptional regulator